MYVVYMFFFFKQKTAYEMRISDWSSTCALPIYHADRDRDAAQAHDVGVHAQRTHGDHRDQNADRQHDDRDQRAAGMEQEQQADQRDDEALLEQGRAQRLDRTHDEVGPVVDRLDADALGQAACKFRDLVLYPADHGQGVLAEARKRSEEHTSELQSLMRISYAVFCL